MEPPYHSIVALYYVAANGANGCMSAISVNLRGALASGAAVATLHGSTRPWTETSTKASSSGNFEELIVHDDVWVLLLH